MVLQTSSSPLGHYLKISLDTYYIYRLHAACQKQCRPCVCTICVREQPHNITPTFRNFAVNHTNLNAASLQSLREFSQLNLLYISEGNSISLEGFSLHQPSRAIPSMTRLGGFYILHKPLTPTRVVTIAYTHKSLLCMSRVTL